VRIRFLTSAPSEMDIGVAAVGQTKEAVVIVPPARDERERC